MTTRKLMESLLSVATGVLLLYAAVTVLKSLAQSQPRLESAPAASHEASSGRCSACFALARREN
jgi:hypothetical protein